MNKKIVNFRTSFYFNGVSSYLVIVFFLFGFGVVFVNLVAGVFFLLLILIIFSTHYRVEIDVDNNVLHDYLWILGLRRGKKRKFVRIQYLYINKNRVSQTMYYRSVSTTIHKIVFDGFLSFSEGDNIHLISEDKKKPLMNKMRAIAKDLKLKIVDYTDEPN